MYAHIRSLTCCVRASALIARSISQIMPSCGGGRWPERIIFAVVMEALAPSRGDDDRAFDSSEYYGKRCR